MDVDVRWDITKGVLPIGGAERNTYPPVVTLAACCPYDTKDTHVMFGYRLRPWISILIGTLLMASLPMIIGQGCLSGPIIPIIATTPGAGAGIIGADGNVPPTFQFTFPTGNIQAELGDVVTIAWTVDDPDDDASITILLDPDSNDNGNEIIIAANLSEDDSGGVGLLELDTGAEQLDIGIYRIIARVTDGVNLIIETAPGLLTLSQPGTSPGNRSPDIQVTLPDRNISVIQGDTVDIAYCGSDADDGQGGVIPDIIVLLDLDDNPLNDLDLNDVGAEDTLTEICTTGTLPKKSKERSSCPAPRTMIARILQTLPKPR